ncbi:3-deoxy-manno-octulosonate cytidylyltransferase [Sphingomonas sp. CJ20]
MTDLIVIPARYGSKRLPGKPLLKIAGHSLLARVVAVARRAQQAFDDVDIVVATDDPRIAAHADEIGCDVVMTDSAISSGSGRALAAARARPTPPRAIINLQGDAPFIPADVVRQLIEAVRVSEGGVVTPVVPLDWDDLDVLRAHKQSAPFSGTTCVRGPDGRAHWFSKNILPAIRDEEKLRAAGPASPVLRHLGLYAYRYAALEQFEAAEPSLYETLEGLEQLRFFALGIPVHTVEIARPRISMSGIDTAEDITLAERMIAEFGDPMEVAL